MEFSRREDSVTDRGKATKAIREAAKGLALPDVAISLHGLHEIVSVMAGKLDVVITQFQAVLDDVKDHEARLRAVEKSVNMEKDLAHLYERSRDHEERLRRMDSKIEGLPTVKNAVYGLIALIVIAVIGAILNLVIE